MTAGDRVMTKGSFRRPGEIAKRFDDRRVGVTLERDDDARQRFEIDPFPACKFWLRGVDVDVRILAQKPEGQPSLPLSTIATAQSDSEKVRGQIVRKPSVELAQQ